MELPRHEVFWERSTVSVGAGQSTVPHPVFSGDSSPTTWTCARAWLTCWIPRSSNGCPTPQREFTSPRRSPQAATRMTSGWLLWRLGWLLTSN